VSYSQHGLSNHGTSARATIALGYRVIDTLPLHRSHAVLDASYFNSCLDLACSVCLSVCLCALIKSVSRAKTAESELPRFRL